MYALVCLHDMHTDLANGKSSITSAVGRTLGGQAGLHTYDSTSSLSTDSGKLSGAWVPSSATLNVELAAGSGALSFELDALIQGFNPYQVSESV